MISNLLKSRYVTVRELKEDKMGSESGIVRTERL